MRHLRAVAAIRRCGSVSKAAASVALSQPALTQGVAKLEQQLGLRLFDRGPSGMVPTAAGSQLADRVEVAAAAMITAFEAIRGSSRSGFRGTENLVTMSQIRALLALASGGSFVVAALSSGLSQPSLHRAVRDVERLSGVVLVERRGRGVGLTPGGHRLARGFNLAINEIQAALDELHALSGVDVGRIRIGAMPLARARLLPMAIARYHRQRPTVTIEVVEGPHAELLERLRDGGLDFLIGALRQPLPGPDVEQEPLFDDRLVIVAGSRHPLAGKPDVSFEALTRFPWVIGRAGTPLRRLWRQLFESRGLTVPPAPIVCGSVMTIRTLLMEGDFLTLLSPIQIRDDLATGALAAIGNPIEETMRPIGLTVRADWRPAPAQREFLELLRGMIEEGTIRGIE